MKKFLLKTFLLLLTLIVGGATFNTARAVDTVYKTALFGSSYNSDNYSYTGSFDATNGIFTVTVANFNNNNNGWTNASGNGQIKCGRSSAASTGTIITKAVIDKAITKVAVTIDAITSDKVNSITLYSSSDKSSWTSAGTFTKSTGTQTVNISSPASNLYYKVEFNCAKGSSNGLITVSKVEYYYDAKTAPELSVNPTSLSLGYGGTKSFTISNSSDATPTVTGYDDTVISVEQDGSDDSKYNVTYLKGGSTTITVSVAETSTYESDSKTVTVTATDGRSAAGIAFASASQSAVIADGTSFTQALTNTNSVSPITWTSSDETVATVASDGTVTLKKAGTVTITASFSGNATYKPAEVSYTLTITNKKVVILSVENIEMDITTETTLASIYTTNSDGEVAITSNAPSIAQIIDGKLKAVGIGDAIITVSIAQSSTYDAIERTFTVTVSSKPGVAPLAYDAGGYKLVTDASTLQAGDILLFVGTNPDTKEDFAMAGQNENNRAEAKVSISDNTISEKPASAQEVTLEGKTDAWYFNVGADAYLYAASSSSNYLKTNTKKSVGDNGRAKIEINTVNGNTTIAFQGSYTNNKLQYYSSYGIFSCYSTTQKPVRFYRYNAPKPYNVTIGTTGYKTIVLANDATMPSGLEAYIVTAAGEKAILTKVDKVKKNTPIILKGVPDTYTLTAIDASEYSYPSTNLLAISTNTTGNGSDGGVYVLANKTNGVGFYMWNGGSLGAGRVYLPGNALEEAEIREFVGFLMDNETGIENLDVNDDLNKAVYDLSGRRIVKPTKGLYIVNGKKYIKK